MIPIAKPMIGEEEINAVVNVMRTGNIAQGEQVFEFEKAFSKQFGFSHSAAISNGTVALHVALLAAGVKPGDRVLTTPFSFIATANSILYCDAIPCFVDIDEDTFNISPQKLKESIERWPDAKHLLIVHLFGQSCQMDEIMEIVNQHGITLIEDCAQAHGAEYSGKPVGTFGVGGTFSFYPTKNMTTGEGGMIVSENQSFIQLSKKLINHGADVRYHHDITGFNYRMTNIAAAIGLAQLDKIEQMNKQRIENALYLMDNVNNELLNLPTITSNAKHVFHQFTLSSEHRDSLVDYLNEKEIGFGIYYPIPIHQQKNIIDYLEYKSERAVNCQIAEEVAKKVISIPVHSGLTSSQLEFITEVLNNYKL